MRRPAIGALVLCCAAASLPAQEREKQERTKQETEKQPAALPEPAAPANPALAELTRAVRDTRRDVEEAQRQADKQAKALEATIAEETKETLRLRDEEMKLGEKLRVLEVESRGLGEKGAAPLAGAPPRAPGVDASRAELLRQAGALKERLAASLVTAQDEEIFSILGELRSDKNRPLPDQVKALCELYERVLRYGRSAVLLQLPVRSPDQGDKVETLKVLRLGMLGGYFVNAATRRSGFVVADPGFTGNPDSSGGWIADAEGLTRQQQVQIVSLLGKPDRGGTLPIDVTGGAVMTTLKARLSPLAWFQRGGAALWILAAFAAAALVVLLERTATLTLRGVQIPRAMRKVMASLEAGRVDTAAEAARAAKSPARAVLQAAVAHREASADVLQLALQQALVGGARELEARLGSLRLIALVSPLVGFAGLIAHLTSAFQLFGVSGAGSSAVASTLAEGLIATEAGLFVAIPCLVGHTLLRGLASRAAGKLEAGALGLAVLVASSRESPLAIEEPV